MADNSPTTPSAKDLWEAIKAGNHPEPAGEAAPALETPSSEAMSFTSSFEIPDVPADSGEAVLSTMENVVEPPAVDYPDTPVAMEQETVLSDAPFEIPDTVPGQTISQGEIYQGDDGGLDGVLSDVSESGDAEETEERRIDSLFRTRRGERARKENAEDSSEGKDDKKKPSRKKAEKGTVKSILIDSGRLIMKIVLIIAAFAAMFTFIFGLARIEDEGMIPSVRDGDVLLYYRLDKNFQNQELAVIKYEGADTCGRVMARAGDVVDIDNQGLVINGNHQQEPDIYFDTTQVVDGVTFPLTVPENAVFLLGDNRSNAVDSRIYGCVELNDVEGKVMIVMRRRNF